MIWFFDRRTDTRGGNVDSQKGICEAAQLDCRSPFGKALRIGTVKPTLIKGPDQVRGWSATRTLGLLPACARENLAVHARVVLPRRFSELAVFDARLYIRVRPIDEYA
jgi:hypothetical protein